MMVSRLSAVSVTWGASKTAAASIPAPESRLSLGCVLGCRICKRCAPPQLGDSNLQTVWEPLFQGTSPALCLHAP